MLDWLKTKKLPIGLFLTGAYWSLMTNPAILTFLSEHPYLNALVGSITGGLALAGILKSDKEAKMQILLKKLDEAPTGEIK